MSNEPVDALVRRLEPVARINGTQLEISDPDTFREDHVDALVHDAVFADEPGVRDAARWIIWAASQALGCGSASIYELYLARGRGEVSPTAFTVPAINLRAATYLTARQAIRAALERDAATLVFEIAKSEMAYTDQRPAEYTAVILAAAMREGWTTPVFLQGDHFQFNAKKWAADAGSEMEGLRQLTREAIEAGFLNIDIDSSTLVDLSLPTVPEQQAVNARNSAELARLVRELQPDGVTISIGGEIGEVGKENSTEEELRAYLDEVRRLLGADVPGLAKVSIQTGTSHGGVPLPDGGVAEVKLDFGTLQRLSRVAREEYGMAGAVQHGASTLPNELFDQFPVHEAAEIHLATGFQNILYDAGGLPDVLRDEMMDWVRTNCADERTPEQTEDQFLYKSRKKAIGPFKRQLWSLPPDAAEEIGANLLAKFGQLFDELKIAGTRALVEQHVRRVPLHRPLPASLGGAQREAARVGAGFFEGDDSGE
ncbi:MAG: class II fructose-bisphosphate aldolase [Chloroflexota bacterium]